MGHFGGLALWDPFWLIGGLLFLGATRYFQTQGPARAVTHQRTTGGSASE